MAVSENNRKFAIGKQRLGIMVEIMIENYL